jgi:ParB-like chromosome segregation protein Spo0J
MEQAEMTATDQGAADTAYLVHLDPRLVLAHPGNLRQDLGDLSELKASIAAQGVVQAPTVIPEGDGYRLAAGHKRTAAAAAVLDEGNWAPGRAPTVPYLVRPDLIGLPAEVVALMLVENDPDQRTALTVSERAAGYAQLAAFNLDETEIARRTGKTTQHVTASLRLHAMSEQVRAGVDAGHFTIEQAAELAEFEDDPAAMARILKDATTAWGIKHQLAAERRRRTDEVLLAELRTELAKAEVTVIDKMPKGWPYDCAAARATDLMDPATGETLDPEQVQALDGFATWIETQASPPRPVVICLDPDAAGYDRKRHTSYRTPAQLAAEQAERERGDFLRTALADAQPIRETFVIETYGSAKAAKAVLVDALRLAVTDPDSLRHADADLFQALAGGSTADAELAKTDRLSRLLVARWIAYEETNLQKIAMHGDAWGTHLGRAVAWLERLVAAGYELSAAEQQLHDEYAAIVAEQDQDDEQDDDGE